MHAAPRSHLGSHDCCRVTERQRCEECLGGAKEQLSERIARELTQTDKQQSTTATTAVRQDERSCDDRLRREIELCTKVRQQQIDLFCALQSMLLCSDLKAECPTTRLSTQCTRIRHNSQLTAFAHSLIDISHHYFTVCACV